VFNTGHSFLVSSSKEKNARVLTSWAWYIFFWLLSSLNLQTICIKYRLCWCRRFRTIYRDIFFLALSKSISQQIKERNYCSTLMWNQHARSQLEYNIYCIKSYYWSYLPIYYFFSEVKKIRRQSFNNINGKNTDINADALQYDKCVFEILKRPDLPLAFIFQE